jgi:hypothetical protein
MKLLGAKLRGIFAKFSEALPTLLRQGYGGFSSPSSSQHPPKDGSAVAEAARYSAQENKIYRAKTQPEADQPLAAPTNHKTKSEYRKRPRGPKQTPRLEFQLRNPKHPCFELCHSLAI